MVRPAPNRRQVSLHVYACAPERTPMRYSENRRPGRGRMLCRISIVNITVCDIMNETFRICNREALSPQKGYLEHQLPRVVSCISHDQ
jgi:hypothetical protein